MRIVNGIALIVAVSIAAFSWAAFSDDGNLLFLAGGVGASLGAILFGWKLIKPRPVETATEDRYSRSTFGR